MPNDAKSQVAADSKAPSLLETVQGIRRLLAEGRMAPAKIALAKLEEVLVSRTPACFVSGDTLEVLKMMKEGSLFATRDADLSFGQDTPLYRD